LQEVVDAHTLSDKIALIIKGDNSATSRRFRQRALDNASAEEMDIVITYTEPAAGGARQTIMLTGVGS